MTWEARIHALQTAIAKRVRERIRLDRLYELYATDGLTIEDLRDDWLAGAYRMGFADALEAHPNLGDNKDLQEKYLLLNDWEPIPGGWWVPPWPSLHRCRLEEAFDWERYGLPPYRTAAAATRGALARIIT